MTNQSEELSVTISIPEACRMLGISQSPERQLARKGQFPAAFKLGGRMLVHRRIFDQELDRLARSSCSCQYVLMRNRIPSSVGGVYDIQEATAASWSSRPLRQPAEIWLVF